VECENKTDTSDKRGNWNHPKIIQTNLGNVPGKDEIRGLQIIAVLSTAHILQKVLI